MARTKYMMSCGLAFANIIYSIDYRTLQLNEEDEYFEMFSYVGWTHVCSS